jgi:AcrR family transcriptional regulator
MYHIAYVNVYNEAMTAQGPAPNKHQQKTETTRRKLLAAAMRVFARDGFEASRIEDIAAEAGHTRGAFYANFDTKEDLFLALLEQQAAKRIGQLQAAIADLPAREEKLSELRRHYVARASDRQWQMLTLEFKLYALRHSKQRARLAAAHQRIRESLHIDLLSQFESQTGTKILLEVVLSGLVLEHSYDPKRVSSTEITKLLGRVFDLLIGG